MLAGWVDVLGLVIQIVKFKLWIYESSSDIGPVRAQIVILHEQASGHFWMGLHEGVSVLLSFDWS